MRIRESEERRMRNEAQRVTKAIIITYPEVLEQKKRRAVDMSESI